MKIEINTFDNPTEYAKTDRHPDGAPAKVAGLPGQYSAYEHYSGQRAVEDDHSDRAWYISAPSDAATVYCRCGRWGARGSFYVQPSKEVQEALIAAHEAHARANGIV